MKNKEQILLLLHEIYWDMEHGALNAAAARLDNLQHESRRGGLNDSCGQLRKRIKEEIAKPNPELV
jgi:hypothetical protein